MLFTGIKFVYAHALRARDNFLFRWYFCSY